MKDYTSVCPPQDLQYSVPTKTDAWDCIEEMLCHAIYMVSGFWASPRALAFLSNVTQNVGSSLDVALETVNIRGIMPFEMWPTPTQFTWTQYYQKISQPILEGLLPTKIQLIPGSDLNVSPVLQIVQFPSGVQHGWVMIKENGDVFDSEPGNAIKPKGYEGASIISQYNFKFLSDPTSYFPKTVNFSPEQFNAFSPECQEAIKANDNGKKNVIVNGVLIHKDN